MDLRARDLGGKSKGFGVKTRPKGQRCVLGGGRWADVGGGSDRGNSWDDPLHSYSGILAFYEKA